MEIKERARVVQSDGNLPFVPGKGASRQVSGTFRRGPRKSALQQWLYLWDEVKVLTLRAENNHYGAFKTACSPMRREKWPAIGPVYIWQLNERVVTSLLTTSARPFTLCKSLPGVASGTNQCWAGCRGKSTTLLVRGVHGTWAEPLRLLQDQPNRLDACLSCSPAP